MVFPLTRDFVVCYRLTLPRDVGEASIDSHTLAIIANVQLEVSDEQLVTARHRHCRYIWPSQNTHVCSANDNTTVYITT